MAPLVTVHHDGSATVRRAGKTIDLPALFSARLLLRELGERAYWQEEYTSAYLYSTLIVIENNGHWFVAAGFRKPRTEPLWLVKCHRWLIERIQLNSALRTADRLERARARHAGSRYVSIQRRL